MISKLREKIFQPSGKIIQLSKKICNFLCFLSSILATVGAGFRSTTETDSDQLRKRI